MLPMYFLSATYAWPVHKLLHCIHCIIICCLYTRVLAVYELWSEKLWPSLVRGGMECPTTHTHTVCPYLHDIVCVHLQVFTRTITPTHNFARLHSQLHVQRHLAPQIHTHVFLELHRLMLTFVSTLNRIHIGLNCETMLNCSTLRCRPTSHQTTSHHICTTWITCTCFNDSMVRSSICPKSRYCKTARYAVYV